MVSRRGSGAAGWRSHTPATISASSWRGRGAYPERLVGALDQALLGLPITNADHRREANIASPTATQDLQRLRHDGWLDQEGGGRSLRYVAGRKLQEAWAFVTILLRVHPPPHSAVGQTSDLETNKTLTEAISLYRSAGLRRSGRVQRRALRPPLVREADSR